MNHYVIESEIHTLYLIPDRDIGRYVASLLLKKSSLKALTTLRGASYRRRGEH